MRCAMLSVEAAIMEGEEAGGRDDKSLRDGAEPRKQVILPDDTAKWEAQKNHPFLRSEGADGDKWKRDQN